MSSLSAEFILLFVDQATVLIPNKDNIYLSNARVFIYQPRMGSSLLGCWVPPPFSKTSHFLLIALIFVFSFPYVQDQNCSFTPSLGMGMSDIIANK